MEKWTITQTLSTTSDEIPDVIFELWWEVTKPGYPAYTARTKLGAPTDSFTPLNYVSDDQKLQWIFKDLGKDGIKHVLDQFTGLDEDIIL